MRRLAPLGTLIAHFRNETVRPLWFPDALPRLNTVRSIRPELLVSLHTLQLAPKSDGMFGNVPFWIVAATLSALVIYGTVMLIKYRHNSSWPMVAGRIEGHTKICHMDNNGSASGSFTSVTYSYSVDGEFYSGEWLTPVLKNDGALLDFLDKSLPVGKAVGIQYMPGHPGRSVLADGPQAEREDSLTQLDLSHKPPGNT
jgi:hypothetical protein